MKIGTFITIFNEDWEREFRPLFDVGFDFFELLPENNDAFTRKRLRRYLKGYGIILHAPFIEGNLISNSKLIRESSRLYFTHSLSPLLVDYSPKVVTTHLGFKAFIYSSVYLDEFRKLIKVVPRITFENMPNSTNIWKNPYPSTEEDIDHVLRRVSCDMTFDVGHFLKQGCDVYRLAKKYMPRIAHIHIHDVVEKIDHQPLGTGLLDTERFVGILRKESYRGYLSIELKSDDVRGAISSFKILKKYCA